MKLTLLNPVTGAATTFQSGDDAAPKLFHEYVLDGWEPVDETGERLAAEIRKVEAMKEASHVRKD